MFQVSSELVIQYFFAVVVLGLVISIFSIFKRSRAAGSIRDLDEHDWTVAFAWVSSPSRTSHRSDPTISWSFNPISRISNGQEKNNWKQILTLNLRPGPLRPALRRLHHPLRIRSPVLGMAPRLGMGTSLQPPNHRHVFCSWLVGEEERATNHRSSSTAAGYGEG